MVKAKKSVRNLNAKITGSQFKNIYNNITLAKEATNMASVLNNHCDSDESDNDSFVKPKRLAPATNEPIKKPTVTSNRFGVLRQQHTDSMDTTEQYPSTSQNVTQAQDPKTNRTYKPPPITVLSQFNYAKFHNELKNIASESKFRLRYNSKHTMLYPADTETHELLMENFRKEGVECFTHPPKDKNNTK